MTKALGYYLNHITHEGASEIEEKLKDLTCSDQLGVIEWLTHRIKERVKDVEYRDFVRVDKTE